MNDLVLDLVIWTLGVPVFGVVSLAFYRGPLPMGRLQTWWQRMPRGLPLKLALITAFLWPILAPFTFVLAIVILIDTERSIRVLKRRQVLRSKLAVPVEHVRRFVPPIALLLVARAAVACGGSYTPADADANQGVVHTMSMVESMCSPVATDAGECQPSRIRGLTRSARCLETSRLHAHAQFVADAGLSCPPEGSQ